ncbi:hypothetical protein [Sphingopyxis sp.]|uniref:hypothetical protein n=1 Tax=Sphingopyxis sp. TaxID=1908224 RepID=UPI003BA8CE40
MPVYRIAAIRPDGQDADRCIDALRIEGTLWPIDTVIDWIRSGAHDFWIKAKEGRIAVVVAEHPQSGRLFLTTEGESFPPHRLLALRRA